MTWTGGLAEWEEGNTTYLSVAFTYLLNKAFDRAQQAKFFGRKVIAGGPALFLMKEGKMTHPLSLIAEIGSFYEDAVCKHNPEATFSSRGCPVGCHFCIVPKMEGADFTLLPDFPVRPILCDNNLSALPAEYQNYVIDRYVRDGVMLKDANSGFEPRTFTPDVYERWKPLLNAGGGPWRFAFDDMKEAEEVYAVFRMLKDEPARRKRVYVLIGNEPFEPCMERIYKVIEAKCEPHVQPFLDLTAMTREPRARFDWTSQQMKDVARWANGFLWRQMAFSEYDRTASKRKTLRTENEGAVCHRTMS
jgi:hypothetical protein